MVCPSLENNEHSLVGSVHVQPSQPLLSSKNVNVMWLKKKVSVVVGGMRSSANNALARAKLVNKSSAVLYGLPCTESDTLRSPGQKEEHPRQWCCSSSDQPGEPGKEKILGVDFVLLKDHIDDMFALFCISAQSC